MDLQRISMGLTGKTALVIVDMINGFTDPACPLGCSAPQVVKANQQLLDKFRELGLPVFYTTVVYHNDQQAQVFRQRIPDLNMLTPGSHWIEIDPALQPRPGEIVIEKQWASGFHKTDLDKLLRAEQIQSLVVTGLTTSGCVRATAVDGLQYDYRVVVPREAVGDRNPEAHEANLFDLHAKYVDVMSLDDTLQLLEAETRE